MGREHLVAAPTSESAKAASLPSETSMNTQSA
jgi:hypothetical protein